MPDEWKTVAELSDFRATSSYGETVDFVRRLEAASPAIHLDVFGRSAMGRPPPVVVVSTDQAFTPAAAAATGKPAILIQSCIRAGEVDGKDASLLLLRDWALGRREPPEGLIAIFVPIYNVDGHPLARVRVVHRTVGCDG